MLATELLLEEEKFLLEPSTKKIRSDSSSTTDSNLSVESAVVRTLELEGVKELFQGYDLQDTEAVSCVICGKSYKSKVCVKKHLWEHSVYWDMFDGLKKQQRVLSIQAAIILAIKFNPSLSLLLVTNSSSGQKKKSSCHSSSTSSNNPKSVVSSVKNLNSSINSAAPNSNSAATSSINRKRKLEDTTRIINKPTTLLRSTATATTTTPTLSNYDNFENTDNFTF